jgi:UDP-GlcNAc3NAcA epimerase
VAFSESHFTFSKMKRYVILSVVGARPQFIKAAALSPEIRKAFREILLHTGQHYDFEMSRTFFRELHIPKPDTNLEVGSGSYAVQTGKMMVGIEGVARKVRPDLVLVYGDTNSTLAGAVVAAKLQIPLGHVEAGLRSYDRQMPEEINRVVADRLSALLFCPTRTGKKNLTREGIVNGVFVTGDVMHDLFLSSLPKARRVDLKEWGVAPKEYYLATVHRAGNADDPGRLSQLLSGLGRLEWPIIFPLHPRTRKALDGLRLKCIPRNLRFVPPMGYLEMIALERGAKAILTDSGGVQKEAFWLGVPCVTLRHLTEWPETLEGAWNVLAGADPQRIARAAQRPGPKSMPRNIFGDGHASLRIVRKIEAFLKKN